MSDRVSERILSEDKPADHGISRAELLIGLSDSFWATLKSDISASVEAFRISRPQTTILVEDAGHRLLLRGDQRGLDLTLLPLERETVRARYVSQRRQTFVDLRLDVCGDALVLRDSKGCVVDEPARFLIEPFLRSLLAERIPRW